MKHSVPHSWVHATKGVSLSAAEKAEGRNQLRAFIASHPRAGSAAMPLSQASPTSWFMGMLRKAVAVATVLACGGGISYAAEFSLPGEALYPLKVNVNENIRAGLTFSSEAQARWELRRVERRLEEATALIATSKFSPEVATGVQVRLNNQIAILREDLARLSENDDENAVNADLRARLESTLSAHGKILGTMAEGKPAGGTVRALLSAVQNEARVTLKERAAETAIRTNGDGVAAQSAADRSIKAAQQTIRIARVALGGGAKGTRGASLRLVAAEKLLMDAQVKRDEGAPTEAFALSQSALRMAREASLLVNMDVATEEETDVEVSASVKTQQDIRRQAAISAAMRKVANLRSKVRERQRDGNLVRVDAEANARLEQAGRTLRTATNTEHDDALLEEANHLIDDANVSLEATEKVLKP